MSFLPVAGAATRQLPPTHREFIPDADQERAIRFIVGQYIVAAFADIGSGKTAITLEAFRRLKALGLVRNMLVIAPVKVCQLTWPPEIAKWTQFRDFSVSFIHGKDKTKALKADADIHLINYEGLAWLCQRFPGRSLPFDIVVFDELSKMRNPRSERFKALRPHLKGVKHRWGLTGTPAPNGYENLFGQLLILDNGAALGQYITHFRDKYFVPSFDGFNYNLKAGADKQIEARVKPYVVRLKAKHLPPVVDVPHVITLPPAAQKLYNAMKRDMLAHLEGGTVSAVNAGAAYSKLLQMANGAVYIGDEGSKTREVIHLHDAKLDALEELVESLQGQQLLVCYAFRHDLERLLKRWPGTPYLGGDVTPAAAKAAMAAWNGGKSPLMFVHPASAGHGLNMQLSGAHNIAWFGMTWDRELYDQAIGRLVRRGNDAKTVYNHLLMVEGSLDVEAVLALHDKDTTQKRLLDRLHDILHSRESSPAALVAALLEDEMAGFQKLGTQSGGDREERGGRDSRDEKEGGGNVPKGWGGRAGGDDDRGGRDDRGRDDRDSRDRDRDDRDRDRPRDDDRDRDRDRDRDDRGRDRDAPRDRDDRDRPRDDDRRDAPRGWGARGGEADDQKERVTDKIAARGDEGEAAPKGWGKPPVEGTNDAPAEKPKRTRAPKEKAEKEPASVSETYGTQAAGVAPDVISVDEAARITGRRGNADVAFNPETGFARVSLELELHMPLGQLSSVLEAMAKALGTPS